MVIIDRKYCLDIADTIAESVRITLTNSGIKGINNSLKIRDVIEEGLKDWISEIETEAVMNYKGVEDIRDQLDTWKTAVIKHPYSDMQSTIQMGQLIAMIVGYISGVEDKIDKLCKQEMKS